MKLYSKPIAVNPACNKSCIPVNIKAVFKLFRCLYETHFSILHVLFRKQQNCMVMQRLQIQIK